MLLSELLNNDFGKNIRNVIYRITNIVNGKVYIGQTSLTLRKRLLSHISHARPNTLGRKHYFQFAILKYGLNNFYVDILESCSKGDLNSREQHWILELQSYKPERGYNCTYGGDGCKASYEISEETRRKISTKNKEKWKSEEYRRAQAKARKEGNSRRSYKIVQLDYSMNFIKRWESKREIESVFGAGNFGRLNNRRPKVYSHGFIWVTEKEYINIQNSEPLLVQLDLNGNIINYFYEYIDANREIYKITGRHGRTQFDCNTKRSTVKGTKKGGYIWMLYSSYKNIKK